MFKNFLWMTADRFENSISSPIMHSTARLCRELPCKEQSTPEKMQGNPPSLEHSKCGEESPDCSDRGLFKVRSALSNPPDGEKDPLSPFAKFDELSVCDKNKSPLVDSVTPRTVKARFVTRRRPSNEDGKDRLSQKLSFDTESERGVKKSILATPLSARRLQPKQDEVAFPVNDAKRLQTMLQASISRLSDLETEKLERYEKWKQEAVAHGMSMVEEERKRSDREHSVLLKRILFLTEELEEVNKLYNEKAQECDELAAWADQLSSRGSVGYPSSFKPDIDRASSSDSALPSPLPAPMVTAWTQCGPTNWLAQSSHSPSSPSCASTLPPSCISPAVTPLNAVRSASPHRYSPRRTSPPPRRTSPSRRYSTPAAPLSHRTTPPQPFPFPRTPSATRTSRGTSPTPAPPPTQSEASETDAGPATARAAAPPAQPASCRYPWSLVRPNAETGALEVNPDLFMRATEPLEALFSRASMDVLAMTRSSWFSIADGSSSS